MVMSARATRAARQSGREHCGDAWGPTDVLKNADRTEEVHLHRCGKFIAHAGKYCLCRCGATKVRAGRTR